LITDILPLAPLQEGILYHSTLELSQADPYIVQVIIDLEGCVDQRGLKSAVDEMLAGHSALRASIRIDGLRQPVQVIHGHVVANWTHTDLAGLSAEEQELRSCELIETDRSTRFAFDRPPLIRFALLKLNDERWRLVVTYHHIIVDGWSCALMIRSVFELYEDGTHMPTATGEKVPYKRFLSWLAKKDRRAAEREWRQETQSLVTLEHGPAPVQNAAPGQLEQSHRELDAGTWNRIAALARTLSTTPGVCVMSAWAIFCARLSGSNRVTYGLTVSGRPADIVGIEDAVGLYINTIPVIARIQEDEPLRALVSRIHAQSVRLIPYHYLGLRDIQTATGNDSPIDTLLVIDNYPSHSCVGKSYRGMTITDIRGGDVGTHYPITMTVVPSATGRIIASVRRTNYAREAADVIARSFSRILKALVECPEHRIGEIALVPSPPVRDITATCRPVEDSPQFLEGSLTSFAATAADSVAVVRGCDHVSYEAFELWVRAIGQQLHERGVGPEVVVAVDLSDPIEVSAAICGVLRAGAAFLPVDREQPPSRIKEMLRDANCQTVLCSEGDQGFDWFPGSVFPLAQPLTGNSREHDVYIARPTRQHPAYVMYTSGSTGRPKGVLMTRGALENLVRWHLDHIRPSRHVLQLARFSFDASIHELLCSWNVGGTVYFADGEARRDPATLLAQINRDGIQKIIAPVVLLHALSESCVATQRSPSSLLDVIATGERLVVTDSMRAVLGNVNGLLLHNHYGPTETHVVTAYTCSAVAGDWQAVPPVGHAISNTAIHILDQALMPVPPLVVGDIYVAGISLARGYVAQPAYTAERFIANPFASTPARMYRTGDRGYLNPDGTVEWVGRSDKQLKIRGFRVDPGDVEAALLKYPEIEHAAVLPENEDGRCTGLTAFLKLSCLDSDADEIGRRLFTALPAHMVPGKIVTVSEWPVTQNGKLDVRELARLKPNCATTIRARAQGEDEELLRVIFSDVLGGRDVGIDDDFFDIGGHSLNAMRLVSRLVRIWGSTVSVRTLFEAPTIRQLRQRLVKRREGELIKVVDDRPSQLPLSSEQKSIWLASKLAGRKASYNIIEAFEVRGTLDVPKVREAFLKITARHEMLRAKIEERDGNVRQIIEKHPTLSFRQEDVWRDMRESSADSIQSILHEEEHLAFASDAAPLFRVRCVRLEADCHVLVWTCHHLIADGWSQAIIAKELSAFYNAEDGAEVQLPPLSRQYIDYAIWQNQQDHSCDAKVDLDYWFNQLDGIPARTGLSPDMPRSRAVTFDAEVVTLDVPVPVVSKLKDVGRSEGATLFMLLATACAVVISRNEGRDDVVLGAPKGHRVDVDLEGVVGCFVSPLVIRTRPRLNRSLRDVLGEVKRNVIDGMQHGGVSVEGIAHTIHQHRRDDMSPLFQISLTVQSEPQPALTLAGARALRIHGVPSRIREDIELHVVEIDGTLRVMWAYRRDLYSARRMARIANQFLRVIQSLTVAIEQPIGRLTMLEQAEHNAMIRSSTN